ncbi:glycosyltransferase family 2 protein [Hymenobacter taeanensis]|uniref:Glycosyltransferase family 2 protein n=1 Tax=Hymenobacter taeanensis TaxID=2735321 RepID=A0A6M6BHP9_9BACT|nr:MULTISPECIES: glycosyltransferase family 2 protein [Hymenobacter]QJX47560.1 glycosyltransferase family 2 protein [Hymenobacter taeanensis]UOQ82956.1 glycosyltransferase family 2 protein [Hymenobacter sp. 5414T-23]
MDLSIVIINYNTYELTKQCIQSVYRSTVGLEYEVVLVDNASIEVDPDVFLINFPRLKLIKSEVNLGFAGGNNLGISECKGRFILLLNSDTIVKDDSIIKAFAFLNQSPEIGVVSSRLVFPDGRHQSAAQRFPSIKYTLFELLRLQKIFSKAYRGRFMLGSFFDNRQTVEVDWVWGTFFMFRKEILDKLPGNRLNEDFFMYCEDMQWCWDIKKLGYKIYLYAEAEVVHIMGGSSGNKTAMNNGNRIIFLNKNYSAIERMIITALEKVL